MSQRLVVEIRANNGGAHVCASWRWGAYTASAMEIADDLALRLEHMKVSKNDTKLTTYRLLRVMEDYGGSLDMGRRDKVADGLGRRYGRGHVFRKFRDVDGDFEFWIASKGDDPGFADGRVVFDLDMKRIGFDVWQRYGDADLPDCAKELVPPIGMNLMEASFADMEGLRKFVHEWCVERRKCWSDDKREWTSFQYARIGDENIVPIV